MNKKIFSAILLVVAVVALSAPQEDRVIPPSKISKDIIEKGNVNGKYTDLFYVLKVPEDKGSYGAFSDYGWWKGGSWAGVKDTPAGYWVYVEPYWLVFKNSSQTGETERIIPVKNISKEIVEKASVNEKYTDLVYVLKVPEDKPKYGDFSDYGWWGGGSWAGVSDNPAGYWVYVAPLWLVFKGKNTQSDVARIVLDKFKGEKLGIRIIHEEVSGNSAVCVYRVEDNNGAVKYCMDKLSKSSGSWKIVTESTCSITLADKGTADTGTSVRVISVKDIAKDIVDKGTANGKYSDLFYVLKVPEDKSGYGEFNDYGWWGGGSWAGVKDNPAGYWVYVYPYWLVFKNKK